MVGDQQIFTKLIKWSFASYRIVDKAVDMSSKDLSCFALLQLTSFVSTRKWLYANRFDNLDEIDNFLYDHNIPKLTIKKQEKCVYINCLISVYLSLYLWMNILISGKEIEFVIFF